MTPTPTNTNIDNSPLNKGGRVMCITMRLLTSALLGSKIISSSGQSLGTHDCSLRRAHSFQYNNPVKTRFGFVCSLAGAAIAQAGFGI